MKRSLILAAIFAAASLSSVGGASAHGTIYVGPPRTRLMLTICLGELVPYTDPWGRSFCGPPSGVYYGVPNTPPPYPQVPDSSAAQSPAQNHYMCVRYPDGSFHTVWGPSPFTEDRFC
jgi:hypothetical protein